MTVNERKKRLLGMIKGFADARILVVGDVMADHYLWGQVDRISPEAPVPVVRVRREDHLLGGAANVAANLRELGAKVSLCSVIGEDEAGRRLLTGLAGIDVDGLVFSAKERSTTVKIRVVAHSQQVVRVDWEDSEFVGVKYRNKMIEGLAAKMPDLDAVIVSDYGKGVVDKTLLDGIRQLARRHKVLVAVDPKIRNMPHYRGFFTMTPNHHETGEALGIKLENTDKAVHAAGKRLRRKLRLNSLVVTRGEEGMSLFTGDDQVVDIPTVAREVFDVTGAGDTVIATLACGLAAGATLHEAALIANFAAGLAIAEVGTASVTAAAVAAAIRSAKRLP
jgi:D-glycero-beta-D-manno-heptose-7-phosphate kinase